MLTMSNYYKSAPKAIGNVIEHVKDGIKGGIEYLVGGSNKQPVFAYALSAPRSEAGPTPELYGIRKEQPSLDNYLRDSNIPRTVASNATAREGLYKLLNFL